jgi:hypothetical protein
MYSSDKACDRLKNWCQDSNDVPYKECMVNSKKMSLCKHVLQTDSNIVKLEEDKVQTPDEHVYNPNTVTEVLYALIRSHGVNASSASHFLSHTSFPIIVYL